MVTIKTLVKKRGGIFVISCNGSNFEVHENTIIKLNLLSDNVSCKKLEKEIIYYNSYYAYYSKVMKTLAKKALCMDDVYKLLKDCDKDIVDDICQELKDKHLINDDSYAKLYIGSYSTNNKYSSGRIVDELSNKGISISEDDIYKLQLLDIDKAFEIATKQSKQTCDKSRMEFFVKCSTKLYGFGYSKQVIDEVLSLVTYDELSALRNVCNKLSKRMDNDKLKKRLYSRGFDYQLIKEELDD